MHHFEEAPDAIYGETAEFYDYLPRYNERGDRRFHTEEALAHGGRVLELGCGTGRVLLPMARAGATVTGVDLTASMLRILERKLAAEPEDVRDRVRLVLGDMTGFSLDERFPLITTPFRSFQHLLTVTEQVACLERVAAHLEPGGRFILDLFQPDAEVHWGPGTGEEVEDVPELALPDGRRLRRTSRVVATNRPDQIAEIEMFYYVTATDGTTRKYTQAFKWRYFFRHELNHLLVRCGFRVLAEYGDYDRSPLTNESPELIVVAERA